MKKAVLIGINYRRTESQLEGCINDVFNVQQFLIDNCGFDPANITLMTDDTPLQPNRDQIQEQLVKLVTEAKEGDLLLFHYSGHGSRVRDRSADETDGMDEVLVPLNYASAGMISDDWIHANVLTKVGRNVSLYAFMDCCHSGTILDLKHNYKSVCQLKKGKLQVGKPYISSEWNDRFLYSRERAHDIVGNVCMFSGSLDREYAADAYLANKAQGAFTFCLLESLKRNMDPTTKLWIPNRVKSRHLLKEVNCRLDLAGFSGQQCQLSASRNAQFESFVNL